MAKLYAGLIRRGLKTLEQVPALIREQVRELLEEPEAEAVNN